MKILIVEDNLLLIDRMKRHLKATYIIDVAHSGKDAFEIVKSAEYSVILLDLGLPDMPGLEVCKRLRDMDVGTPILVLTAADDQPTRVKLLKSGADDYVVKPFDYSELQARIAALARRQPLQRMTRQIVYSDMVIDIDRREVRRAGVAIPLRRKEFDILEYLVANKGRIMTREMILAHAWNSEQVSWDNTVDVHIKNLRDKIDRPFQSRLIKTAYGIGYKIDALE